MASLRKRNGVYYIRFFAIINGKRKQKSFSLGTTIKREAEKLQFEYEDKFERGEIDPFHGWSPKLEVQRKREKLRGKFMSLADASDLFIEERSQANETTKENYRQHLNMLMDQLGRTMPVTQIHEKDIREFCFRKDLAAATQASYLRHLKVFFSWLSDKNILPEVITDKLKPPKIPQKISQKTVSREELDDIFSAFDVYNKKMKKRGHITKPEQERLWFKPMINMMYYCGLRAKEAVNLTWDDVDLKKETNNDKSYGWIRVTNSDTNTTKTGKERNIPIREPLYKWLKQWYIDQGKPTEGYVFPSATGFSPWHKMDPMALSKSYKKFVKLAKNVPNTPTLHGLRHSCATDLLAKGVPAVMVQKIMGHASINTTMIYEHLDSSDVQNAIRGIDE